MKRKKNIAKVYNAETDIVTEIPISELAPGMVRIFQRGKGTVWIQASDLSKFQMSPKKGYDFSAMRDILAEIKETFDGYYTITLEEWEAGFQRDRNPEKEIAGWLIAARKMRKYAPGGPCPKNNEVYKLISNLLVNGESARHTFTPEILTKDEIDAIMGSEPDDFYNFSGGGN